MTKSIGIDLDWLITGDGTESCPEHVALDSASALMRESLDMAQHVFSHSKEDRKYVLALAIAHALIAGLLLAVRELKK